MKSHRRILLASVFSCVAFSVCASRSRADAPAAPAADAVLLSTNWKTAPVEQLQAEINRIGEAIREKVGSSEETKKKLDFVWTDPLYTSEKIEEKRKTIREAEATLIKAQIELREEVSKLPEVVKMSVENQALQNEITKLRQQKKIFVQLLGDRTKAEKTNN